MFYEDPRLYFGKTVWFHLAGGSGGVAGGIALDLYSHKDGPNIGHFGAACAGVGGCDFSGELTYTSGP